MEGQNGNVDDGFANEEYTFEEDDLISLSEEDSDDASFSWVDSESESESSPSDDDDDDDKWEKCRKKALHCSPGPSHYEEEREEEEETPQEAPSKPTVGRDVVAGGH
jgi:hypothetical protein